MVKKSIRWDRIFERVVEYATAGAGAGVFINVLSYASSGTPVTIADAFKGTLVVFFITLGISLGFVKGYREENEQ